MPDLDLDVILTGSAPMPLPYVLRPANASRATALRTILFYRGEMLQAPCLAYAVRDPSAGTVLIDTGFHPDAAAHRRRDFGLPMALMFRKLRVAEEPYPQQLRGLGIEPASVERVVMTHLHVDHTSGMRLLPNARFLCDRREWLQATARNGAANGFIAGHLPPEERMELLDFDRQGEPYGPFDATIDLLGDGRIRLISTPGHTRGHLSVLLRAGDGREVLIVGDAAYTLQSIREQRLSLLTHDDEAYRRSLAQLKAFSEQNPSAVLVPTHDPSAWKALGERAAASR